MNELGIVCNLESPQEKDTTIIVQVENNLKEDLLYKYMIGCNGAWSTLKDFNEEASVEWIPNEDGKYIIMVQAKKRNGEKSFDYVSRIDYIIGKVEEKLINNITLNKHELELGEKLNLFVEANKSPLMFKYWIRIDDEWKVIKDYSADRNLVWTTKAVGRGQILIESKNVDSKNKYDDFQTIDFEVSPLKEIEIMDFKCLSSDLVVGSEIIFQVDASYSENRTILYKFLKINFNGEVECIQDYSTKRIVNYVEKISGDYKILCMVKDMYSTNKYDDRAIINFKVKKYKEIFIKSFTTDLNSPQLCETPIELRAEVIGGRELLYRYVIEGNSIENSGYTRNNTYIWRSKEPGNYKILVWVKDKSFEGEYEAVELLNFIIDKKSKEPVRIDEVLVDKNKNVLINEKINFKVIASGGTDLRYSFIIKENGKEIGKIDYGTCNWADFTPKEQGSYEFEIRVKDKYSGRDFDCHSIISLEVFSYIPANIDYILFPAREHYVVGDSININVITRNTISTLLKYILKINDRKVEETEYVHEKGYTFSPKRSGLYSVEIFAKNKDSDKPFDYKKDIKVAVYDAFPVTNTKITCNKTKFLCNESVNFTVHSEGGKDVVYEFYIMEKGEWNLVQNYSKKNYYTFIPFAKEEYRALVLAKSQYSEVSYEDYDTFTFNVE
ncbi:triple tyrosine motif-containing protein [Clostridiaceae bacterium UIB06]|uniref:Triple tyrosine motif-containing protein n=1 Tax=Clostridium thailandense TaxID=2794346 RepID=A0A949WRU5_9CLOT|nr:triple tyrosine motif-containing protein [Clostridium thailandense]MBV7274371.1 triple tyrosine motif-containing protein [Clostridium thailandense]MCH5136771.1 triple tyrosine motif-containing protein [Clostridiaceae bacterium UIB06]